jgi:hypothetical protein
VTAFTDSFAGAAALLGGRVTPTGQPWIDLNGYMVTDGAGGMHYVPLPGGDGGHGAYPEIQLDEPVTSMRAKVSFQQVSGSGVSGGFVLIYGNGQRVQSTVAGHPPTYEIFPNAVHCVFDQQFVVMSIYNNYVPDALVFTYSLPTQLAADGTQYDIGIEMRGPVLTIIAPGLTPAPILVDPRYLAYATDPDPAYGGGGRLIWQEFNIDPGRTLMTPSYNTVSATTAQLPGFRPSLALPSVLGPELEPTA